MERPPEHMPTAAAYARTDHDDGTRTWDSIDRQQQNNSAAATRLGIQIVAGFVDIGQRGNKTNRPGLNHLLAHAEERPFDYVAVNSIDRLATKSDELTNLLLRLKTLGVNVLMADHDTVIELVLPSNLEVLHGGNHE